jgi:undecaprenyl-phosphate galactose phosphotransferase
MSAEFMYIEKANFLALIIITLIIFAAKTSDTFSRSIILIYFALNILLPIGVYFLKRKFMLLDPYRENIVVICDEVGEEDVNNWFVKDNSFGFNIKKKIFADRLTSLELQKSIEEEVNSDLYYAAVISLAKEDTDQTFKTVNYIMHHMKRVYVLPKISKLPLFNSEFFNSINHKGMALYVKNRLLNPADRMIKEIFDKAVSFILLVVFLPILFILYIVVYISTKGHPLFKHKRVGQDGKKFNIYKFRTMRMDADKILKDLLENDSQKKAEWEKEYKLKDDPRVTRIGNFLRKTSLDELPQIINVFQGKMSLVGPRPIIDDEIAMYGDMFDYFKAVKPGITGLWQVSGRNDIAYDERVQLDVWYARNWSIELDIVILVKTVVIVLTRKGSY